MFRPVAIFVSRGKPKDEENYSFSWYTRPFLTRTTSKLSE